MPTIEETIKEKLSEIEEKHNVKIIYACESGSRAWGFASPDSDYDVRFVYVRDVRDYLRLERIRDVIEYELNDIYDINGWDIKKLLLLLAKSNPVIFEWADSPVVYRTTGDWKRVESVMPEYFSEHIPLFRHHRCSRNRSLHCWHILLRRRRMPLQQKQQEPLKQTNFFSFLISLKKQ